MFNKVFPVLLNTVEVVENWLSVATCISYAVALVTAFQTSCGGKDIPVAAFAGETSTGNSKSGALVVNDQVGE